MKSAKGSPVVIGAKKMSSGSTARSANGAPAKLVGKKGLGGLSPAASKSGGDSKLVGGKLGK